jgi:hypothetical protein
LVVLRVFGCDDGLVEAVEEQSSYMSYPVSLIALATGIKLAVLEGEVTDAGLCCSIRGDP